MTVEERLARLEVRADGNDAWLRSIDTKVDRLVEAMNMGKGAWVLVLKAGAVLVALAGAVGSMVAAAAWVFDKFHK